MLNATLGSSTEQASHEPPTHANYSHLKVPIMSQAKTRPMNEPTQSVKSSAQPSCSTLEEYVGENVGTALLLSGAIGFGAGIAIGLVLGQTHEPEPVSWFDSRTAEKVGRQFLANMSRFVPESVSSRFS